MATNINEKTIQNWNKAKAEIVDACKTVELDPKICVQIAGFESGFNPTVRPISSNAAENTKVQFDGVMAMTTAYGYGQFLDDTWLQMLRKHGHKYGVENADKLTKIQANEFQVRKDTHLQASMLAEFTKENIEIAKDLSSGDLSVDVYVIHNLGQNGGKSFLSALKENAAQPISNLLPIYVIKKNS